MPEITFTIPSPINASVQVGDTAHYIKINAGSGGFTTHTENTQLVTLGTIRSITPQYTQGAVVASPQTDTSSELMGNDTTMDENIDSYQIQCFIESTTPQPTTGDFIFFSKDRRVNENDAKGYYGEFTFKNNSRDKVELFATACQISESSK